MVSHSLPPNLSFLNFSHPLSQNLCVRHMKLLVGPSLHLMLFYFHASCSQLHLFFQCLLLLFFLFAKDCVQATLVYNIIWTFKCIALWFSIYRHYIMKNSRKPVALRGLGFLLVCKLTPVGFSAPHGAPRAEQKVALEQSLLWSNSPRKKNERLFFIHFYTFDTLDQFYNHWLPPFCFLRICFCMYVCLFYCFIWMEP